MSLAHKVVPSGILKETRITEDLLRLSVGLKDVEDLWSDLAATLNQIRAELAPVA